jgi:hypothetical protein
VGKCSQKGNQSLRHLPPIDTICCCLLFVSTWVLKGFLQPDDDIVAAFADALYRCGVCRLLSWNELGSPSAESAVVLLLLTFP